MNDDSPAYYEIRIEGVLDRCWDRSFDGLRLRPVGTQTVISGRLPDQAALHGVLSKIRDLGLRLVSVARSTATGEEESCTG